MREDAASDLSSFNAGVFMIVRQHDDGAAVGVMERALSRYRSTRTVVGTAEAVALLERHPDAWTAIILSPTTCPRPWSLARSDDEPRATTTLLVAALRDEVQLDAVAGVYMLGSPPDARRVQAFVRAAVVREILQAPDLSAAVDQYALTHALTPRESELVAAAVAGISCEAYLDEVGIAANTRRRQVQSLLRKCREQTLDRVALRVMRNLVTTRQ
jgi:hypothetical protein